MSKCVFCQNEVEIVDNVGRLDDCPTCERPLHCCLQCKHYDEKAFHECHEHVDFRIIDKDRSNYCELFVFGRDASVKTVDKNAVKAKLESLFKK